MAGGRIRGITIELGGDTSKFVDAIKKADKSINETQKKLKDVNKLLKLDPGNTDLLRQKQETLAKAVEQTGEKSKALKQALKEMEAAGITDKNREQYDALQRELFETEKNLKSLKKESNNFGSVFAQQVSVAGDALKNVGGKITSVGEGLTKSVTAPLAGVAAASVAAWKEVDAGLDIVVTKTGASGAALEDMQNRAQNIATTIPTSFEAAGTAIGEVNTRFGLTGDELEKLSTQFIQFAKINGTDVNSSIDSVQKVLSAFGLSAEDAGAVLDTLNKVGENTGIGMDTLAGLMVSNATAFQGFGLNAADAANVLGTLEKSGIDTSVVMTGLSKVQAAAMKDGVSMQEKFAEALGSSESAIDTFGAKAGPKLYAAFQSGTISADMFTESQHNLGDALGSTADTFNATLSPLDQTTVVLNQLKTIGADLVNTAGPALADIFQRIGEAVKTVSEKWKGLSEGQKQTILTVAGIIAAVGPLLAILGKVITVIGSIMTMAPAISAAFAALSGPIGLAVAAIAGLIAIGVALGKHWDEVVAWTKNLGRSISTGFDNILKSIRTAVNNAWTAVRTAFQNIVNAITNAVNNARNTVSSVFNAIKNTISSILNSALGVVQSVVNSIKAAFNFSLSIPSIATGALDVAKGAVDWVVSAIKGAFNFSLSLPSVATGVFSSVTSTVQGIVDKVKGAMNFSWSLPVLKVPRVTVDGGTAPWGIGGKGRLPSFNVTWHKDAYDNPMLFTRPTVLATPNGFHGFGDGNGSELVIGTNKLREIIGATGNNINVNVYAAPGMNETALANAVALKLDRWLGERV
jgi:phage-related minor tail protein